MLLFPFLLTATFSLSQEEMDNAILTPPFLSDFVNARQIRNLTITSTTDTKAAISGLFYTKPFFTLSPSLQPTYLVLTQLEFHSFDGKIISGESNGIARLADIRIYDCVFRDGFSSVMSVKGPKKERRDAETY